MRLFWVVTVFISILPSAHAEVQRFDPTIVKAQALYCEGKLSDAKSVVDAAKESKQRSVLAARVFDLSFEDRASSMVAAAFANNKEVSLLSSEDRIVLAYTLLFARSQDLDRVSELIQFEPKNSEQDIYLKQLVHWLRTIKTGEVSGIQMLSEGSVNLIPDVVSYFLGVSSFSPSPDNVPHELKQAVDSLDDSFGMKSMLLADIQLASSGWSEPEKVLRHIQKAYSDCPYDDFIAAVYASGFVTVKDYSTSEKILERAVRKAFRTASVDLMAAEVYLNSHRLPLARQHLALAEKSQNYLTKEERSHLEKLKSEANRSFWNGISGWYGLLVLCILIAAISVFGIRRSRQH